MAFNEFPGIDTTSKGGKGGLWGKIAGGALALGSVVAAPFTGGTSMAALPAALGAGAVAAPIVGNAIDPVKVDPGVSKPGALQTAAMQDDSMTEALITQGRNDLVKRSDIPDDQARIKADFLDNALAQIRARRNM